jgi:hypothetical protein
MIGSRPVSGETLMKRPERGSKARRIVDELADHADDVSDTTGNYATMLRQRFAKQSPDSGPGLAHAGTPEVPVIVEAGHHAEGLGAHDLVSNMVLMTAVIIKGSELAVDSLTAKFKERHSGHGR